MKRKSESKIYLFFIIIIVIVSVLTIGFNKYNYYYETRTIQELKNAVILKNAKIQKENDQKLIYITGYLNYDKKKLHDNLFDIYVKTPRMLRLVETYQWVEHETVSKNGEKKYKYTKEWSSNLIDSKTFHDKAHKNPTKKYAEDKWFEQNNIKIGDFNISKLVYYEIQSAIKLNLKRPMKLPEGFKVNGSYITNAKNYKKPNIGDTRVIYFYSDWTLVSILAKQNGDLLERFTSKNGEKFISVMPGRKNFDEIINGYNYYIVG